MDVRAIGLVVLSVMAPGCYLSHELEERRDAGFGSRLFEAGGHLLLAATVGSDRPILLSEIDPVSLETIAELAQIAPPLVGPYNRSWIASTATPRGLAFVWTEGPIGPDNLRPFLRLYDCCVGE